MELIGLLFFGWIIYTVLKNIGYQEASAQSAVEPLKTSVSLNNENISKDLTLYDIKAKGNLPNFRSMHLVGALYIDDKETNLPFLSNFSDTDESPESRVFFQEIDFGYQDAGKYLPNWTPLAGFFLEGIQHPKKGERVLNIDIFWFDKNNPVKFFNGRIIQGQENILHQTRSQKSLTFTEDGYMDLAENSRKAKPIMIGIGMGMAMSDGSLDVKEGNVLKNWIKKQINAESESNKENLKNLLNDALEKSFNQQKSGFNVEEEIKLFNELAPKNLKYQLIELCLDILSADGVADSKELIMLRELTEKLDLNFDEVQNMKDKAILNLDLSKNSQLQSDTDQDEIDVGMKEKLTKKEALDFIKNEFKKWNGRLNSLKDSSQREHAQKMLDALARLRKKYEDR